MTVLTGRPLHLFQQFALPGYTGELGASLVWDGTDEVRIPEIAGTPRDDQMAGTALERLTEFAGRTCYDSLGTGRSTAEYHDHLIQVGHFSVHEHSNWTIEILPRNGRSIEHYLPMLLNRRGIWTTLNALSPHGPSLRITVDLRAVMEWPRWTREALDDTYWRSTNALGALIVKRCAHLAPQILTRYVNADRMTADKTEGVLADEAGVRELLLVEPQNNHERWIALYMAGSRGFSHEQVRHGDWTAISQRSTRYVDESESQWVLHPLLGKFLADEKVPSDQRDQVSQLLTGCYQESTRAYREMVKLLESYLRAANLDKVSARKQARGAARAVLGTSLSTLMVFSGSVAQWRHMIRMRAANAADGEIRADFTAGVLPSLRESRYADCFEDCQLAPASDGIGLSLIDGGAK